MTDELKAALERMKSNSYAETDEDMMQYGDDARLLADAYVELMARRESSREQGEFHAPTLEWFEWLIGGMQREVDNLSEYRNDERSDHLGGALAACNSMAISSLISTLRSWQSKFESCGAFDRDDME